MSPQMAMAGMANAMMGNPMAMMGAMMGNPMMAAMMGGGMGGGNREAQEAMMQQQQQMMRQYQQQMMTQMGAMQQFMMGQQQMFTNAMCMSSRPDAAPEEVQRQMGRQAYANAIAAMGRQDSTQDGEDDEAPSGPSSSVMHPNYRPPDSEPLPGVTDKRFVGKLKLWFEDKGYGFIVCDGMKARFPDIDVFLHQNQKRHFTRGDNVSFSVFINFKGKPQATELRRAKAEEHADAAAD